jgi:hypothetical protein
VPEEWRVIAEEQSAAGGVDVHVAGDAALDEDAPTLRIDTVASLGWRAVTTGSGDPRQEAEMNEGGVLDGSSTSRRSKREASPRQSGAGNAE